jgi:hypothetical protein
MKFRSVSALALLTLIVTSMPVSNAPVEVAAQSQGASWVEVKTMSPVPELTSLVYDSDRHGIFALTPNSSGNMETWKFDGMNWLQAFSGVYMGTPASTNNVVYDAGRKREVLFGTKDTHDPDSTKWKTFSNTYEFDGSGWYRKATPNSPPPREHFSMVYDSLRSRVIVFGGYVSQQDAAPVLLNDTWEYDGNNWVEHDASTAPVPRYFASVTYDSARGKVVLFGGNTQNQTLNDTWEYDGSNWTQKPTQHAPAPRCKAALAFDSSRAQSVLFGGGCNNPTLSDTWEYDGSDWRQINSAVSPPDREAAGLAYDSGRRKMVLASGDYMCNASCLGMSTNAVDARDLSRPAQGDSASAVALSPSYGGGGTRSDTWEYVGPSVSKVPHLQITGVQMEPNPATAGERTRLRITLANTGTQRLNNAFFTYTGRYSLSGDSVGERLFGTNNDSYITPLSIAIDKPEQWQIVVNAVFGSAATPGQLRLSILPQLAGVSELSAAQTVTVNANPFLFGRCAIAVVNIVAKSLGWSKTSAYSGALNAGANCKDSKCIGQALAELVLKQQDTTGLSGVLTSVAKAGSSTGWSSCLNLSQLAVEYGKALIAKGGHVTFLGIHSPANPLLTDANRRRTGILDNGTLIQEIPGSEIVVVAGEKYLFYGSDGITVQLKGTASGTMTVEMASAGGGSTGQDAIFQNVPVTRNLVAQLASSSGTEASMQIDSNSDGRADEWRKPDTVTTISVQDPNTHAFGETSKVVTGRFWQVWQGGRSYQDSLFINGLPITDKRPEVNPTDGKTYETQWFERARFEYHPENKPPNDVLLGLMGVRSVQSRQDEAFKPFADLSISLPWFSQTRHTLGDTSEGGLAIAAFWNRLGGLAQFGYPLSQPFVETSKENGKPYLVQYFERQRFEYHPENKGTQYEVLLGRLGAEQLGK